MATFFRSHSSKHPTSYDLQWHYHHDDLELNNDKSLPEYLWFLRHTRRVDIDVYKSLSKPTYDMDLVTGVFSHGAVTCVYGEMCFAIFLFFSFFFVLHTEETENSEKSINVRCVLLFFFFFSVNHLVIIR